MYQLRKNLRLIIIGLCFLVMAYGSFLDQLPLVMLGLAAIGLVILAIPIYRIWYDYHITQQANEETPLTTPIQRASPSNRLFVPPPKQK